MNRSNSRVFILPIAFAVILSVFWYFDLLYYFSPIFLEEKIGMLGVWAPVFFVLIATLGMVLFLPLTPFALLAGVLFGTFYGVLLIYIASLLSLFSSFYLSRYFLHERIQEFFAKRFPKIFAYDEELEQNGLRYVFLLRFPFVLPFSGVNYSFGLTRVRLKDFFFGSALGIFPGLIAYVYLGQSFATLEVRQILFGLAIVVLVIIMLSFLKRKFSLSKNMIVTPEGKLSFGGKTYRCAIGENGVSGDRQEGDKTTPAGEFLIRRVWYRADRIEKPETVLPARNITKQDGWSDDTEDRENYNQHVILPYAGSHEMLWREDHIYDIVVELGYNDAPMVSGKGSAIFLHLARETYTPTAGCIALGKDDLLEVLQVAKKDTLVCVRK